ncbi:MAG: N-acetylmuramoyl-L-alanine amidase [Oscillospiraceae bacterium]|nr:N-acetylmuramoyl-L-alanine amidase [Oscillospiraceae bacterium]
MNKTIFLDPGHGGVDPGAVNGARFESHDNLRLGRRVQALLERQAGVNVAMSRTLDVFVSLGDRTNHANRVGADLFVSLHRNGFTSPAANGFENWIFTTASAVDEGAAREVLERVIEVGVQSNRGIKRGNFHVLRESRMPSILVELGFITNTRDNELFDTHFEAYAQAVARGACAALGITFSGEAPRQLARIQLGAYTWPDNEAGARRDLARIRALPGLQDAWLVIPSNDRAERD